MQRQLFITIYAITLSKTAGQSLWRNNKNIKFYKLVLVLKSLPEKELIHPLRSGANSRHTSLTLSKHSPTASIRTLAVLRGEFVWPKPHPDFKRVVFLMVAIHPGLCKQYIKSTVRHINDSSNDDNTIHQFAIRLMKIYVFCYIILK